ncbi:MAG: PDZ domain-containing protein [Planctomycetales bacterium]|nr:PDZ domain-containing protein [Planctomycetales bacterium]
MQHRLYLRPSKYYDSPELLDKSGLELIVHEGVMTVANSTAESPAHSAGLHPYDKILRVNGNPVTEYTLRALRELMCQDGEVVKIEATSRSDSPVNAEFQLREFRTFSLDVLKTPDAILLAELPLRTGHSTPLIPVSCFGREQTMLLDTRVGKTVFREGLRSELGEPIAIRKVAGSHGNVDVAIYNDTEIQLANFSLKATRVDCQDLGRLSEAYGVEIDGIIGMMNFANLVLELDLAQDRVRVYDHVPREVVASSDSLPLSNAGKGIAVTTSIPHIGFEDFGISTALPGSIRLQKNSFQQLAAIGGVRKQTSVNRCFFDNSVVGKIQNRLMKSATLDAFRLGQSEHQNLTIDEGEVSAICRDYLERFIVVFDFPGRRLYLRPSRDYEAPEPPNVGSGLCLIQREGRILVEGYDDGSPSGEAGVKLRDEILSVNGKPAKDYPLDELRELLKRKGETVKLVVRRGEDEPFSVEFMLQDYRKYLPDAKVNAAGDVDFNP